MMMKPGVSAIVCCYNSTQVIESTIRALARQEVPENTGYEVILVDNNCTDNTVRLAENAWSDKIYPLKIVKENQAGLIFARKAGVVNAQYENILFVDDDNILNNDWIKKLNDLYKKFPGIGVIGGLNQPLIDGEKPHWFDEYAGVYACKPQNETAGILMTKKTLFGAGLSFRTSILLSIFNSGLPLFLIGRSGNHLLRGEDSELCLRAALMGWNLYYDSSLVLKHYLLKERINWDYVINAKKGGGAADIILRIYNDMISGRQPLTYNEISSYICQEWLKFWQKNKNLTEIQREGSPKAALYYYFLGLTEAILHKAESDYDEIRRKIIDFF